MAPVPQSSTFCPHPSPTFKQQPWGSVFADKMLVYPWSVDNGWKQASIRSTSAIPLPPSSSVFHYGTSVFEGMKAFNTSTGPSVFRPDLHLKRLQESATRIALPAPPPTFLCTLLTYVHSVRKWIPASPPEALYLRVTLMATNQQLGGRPPTTALLFVIATPVSSYFPRPATALQDGLRLYADVDHTRAAQGGVGYCKTGGNYAASLAPLRDAKLNGYDQVLWLSDLRTRKVSEVGVMNIFFVYKEGTKIVLETPEVDGTFLNGVTRRSALALAGDMGIEVREREVRLDEVFKAAYEGTLLDMFGTGTAAVVCPVSSITCHGETVKIRDKEREGDFSVSLRKKLLSIHKDGLHEWMTSVQDGGRVASLESEHPLTTACIGI